MMVATDNNITFCQAQLKRFSGTSFWSNVDDIAKNELVKALLVSAESPAQAEAWISLHLLESPEYPKPADFARYAAEYRKELAAQVSWKPDHEDRANACPLCHGTGWHIVFALTTREERGGARFAVTEPITEEQYRAFSGGKLNPLTQSVASGAKRCKCDPTDPHPLLAEERRKRREHDAKWAAFCADPKNKKLLGGRLGGLLGAPIKQQKKAPSSELGA
jgi:hypothetical protein